MRRIRDTFEDFELRRAKVYTARKNRPCDVYDCDILITVGTDYALVSTGIARCNLHFQPEDVVNAE